MSRNVVAVLVVYEEPQRLTVEISRPVGPVVYLSNANALSTDERAAIIAKLLGDSAKAITGGL